MPNICKLALGMLLIATTATFAQTIPPQQPPQKDRKDFIIEGLITQRNEANDKTALCYADANNQLAERAKEIAALKAEVEKLKKLTDAK